MKINTMALSFLPCEQHNVQPNLSLSKPHNIVNPIWKWVETQGLWLLWTVYSWQRRKWFSLYMKLELHQLSCCCQTYRHSLSSQTRVMKRRRLCNANLCWRMQITNLKVTPTVSHKYFIKACLELRHLSQGIVSVVHARLSQEGKHCFARWHCIPDGKLARRRYLASPLCILKLLFAKTNILVLVAQTIDFESIDHSFDVPASQQDEQLSCAANVCKMFHHPLQDESQTCGQIIYLNIFKCKIC